MGSHEMRHIEIRQIVGMGDENGLLPVPVAVREQRPSGSQEGGFVDEVDAAAKRRSIHVVTHCVGQPVRVDEGPLDACGKEMFEPVIE